VHSLSPALVDFIGGHHDIAVAVDRRTTILAASPAATAAWPSFHAGQNIARTVFLDPELDGIVEDLPDAIAQTVSLLREGLADGETDATDIAFLGELMSRSSVFARLWASPEPLRETGTLQTVEADSSWTHYRYVLSAWATEPGVRILTWKPTPP
jgi:hypothetical protein